MRRLACVLLALAGALPARALPPPANRVSLQPTDVRDWACVFPVAVSTLVSSSVTVLHGSDAGAAALLNTPNVTGTQAVFRLTGTGRPSGTVYRVAIVVGTATGQRYTCDGVVTIQTRPVVY